MNLHTHGLHISPAGNSDNVLLEVPPGTAFPYEFNIPADHPAGTFWYYPHRHGSMAMQFSSGMVGALIVLGTRRVEDKLAGRESTADIDTVLRNRNGRPLAEQVMVFEQLSYGCFDDAGKLLARDDEVWTCPDGKNGEVRDLASQLGLAGSGSR